MRPVQLKIGAHRYSMERDEAIELARELVAAVDALSPTERTSQHDSDRRRASTQSHACGETHCAATALAYRIMLCSNTIGGYGRDRRDQQQTRDTPVATRFPLASDVLRKTVATQQLGGRRSGQDRTCCAAKLIRPQLKGTAVLRNRGSPPAHVRSQIRARVGSAR